MNKAFVRETAAEGDRCPHCGSPGYAVSAATLDAHLKTDARSNLAETGWFCGHPTCQVAYFDMFERTCDVNALKRPVYPKDPAAPICGCFGFHCEEIERDLQEGVVTRTRTIIERAKSPDARCSVLAADGRCCVAEVQRYYMQRKASE